MTTEPITLQDLASLATKAGWTTTCVRLGRVYFRTPTGGKAWIDHNTGTFSFGFWLLANASVSA